MDRPDGADQAANPAAEGIMIRLEHISKRFDGSGAPAIGDLSLDFPRGEIVTLVGPSGCGKTTTLKLINRLIEPTSGRIEIDGKDALKVDPSVLRLGIGYVIQQVGLFPHRTIRQNIGTVPSLLGWERGRIRERVDELIELVGLDPQLLDRYPAALSGGQQQRVGVARALAADPPVLLMDEPFGAVDPIVRNRLQDELLRLQETLRKTVVLVTHDIDEAIKLGDRMALLNVGGVLEQFGLPEEILRAPASEFVDRFIGGERGLKRLALIRLAEIELDQGPVVGPNATKAEARAAMDAHGTDWVGIVDNGKLLGWVWGEDFAKSGRTNMEWFRVTLAPSNSAREALDEIITSRTQVAVVCDGDHYLGMTTLEQIRSAAAR
jgi:osmoprotectant transport system ATP-binding protein